MRKTVGLLTFMILISTISACAVSPGGNQSNDDESAKPEEGEITQAGTCNTPNCGGVVTNLLGSTGTVYVANNWCWSSWDDYYGNSLPCASTFSDGLWPAYTWLDPGMSTLNLPAYYDTDAIGVPPGCALGDSAGNIFVDNRGSSSRLWRKMFDISTFTISHIICDYSKWWVTTFADAPGYSWPGGSYTGYLVRGYNYVYCRTWGPQVGSGNSYNHWWLKTDLDSGSPWQSQWVSAYYLSKWGNDIARDDAGNEIPNC